MSVPGQKLTGHALFNSNVDRMDTLLRNKSLYVGGALAGIGIYNASNTIDRLRTGDTAGAMVSGSLAAGAGYAAHAAITHSENYQKAIAWGANLLKNNAKKVHFG
jgi:hypothetical protein